MLTYVVKSFQQSIRLEKRYINTVHFPFSITFSFIEDDAQIKRNIFFKLNAFCFTGQYMRLMLTLTPTIFYQFCIKVGRHFYMPPTHTKCTIYVGGWSVYLQYSCLGHLCSFWLRLQYVGLCLGASVLVRKRWKFIY